MTGDLKAALRSLLARPAVAAMAVACLALGIGVNIALFGVVDALLFRPPTGVVDPEGLVRVRVGYERTGLGRGVGPTATFPQLRTVSEERGDMFASFAAYGRRDGTLGSGPEADPLQMTVVSSHYFTLLGVQPSLGRVFDQSETAQGAAIPVAVLSHRFWERAYGADPTVIGRSIRVNGHPMGIIGVAPEGFVGVDLGDPDLWIPMGLLALPEFGGDRYYSDRVYWLQFMARLRPGLDLSQARAMTARDGPDPELFIARPLSPADLDRRTASIPVSVLPLRTMFFEDQQGRNPVPLWALGISAAVLLLACGTVANLLLAQAVVRRRDVAIRLALGATPGQIVRTQLLESLLLALFAAGASTILAEWSIVLVRSLPVPPIPTVLTARSILFGIFVALLAPVFFGVVPAFWAARREVGDVIRGAGGGITAVPKLQRGFMAAQTAISFSLLLVAGLFLRSLVNVRAIDTGMDFDRIVMVYPDIRARVDSDAGTDAVAESIHQVQNLPGVESVALGGIVPFYMFTRGMLGTPREQHGEPRSRSVIVNSVGPGFFESLGIRILAGRGFTEGDGPGSSQVAILSERLAEEDWAGVQPIGECVFVGGDPDGPCTEVVGIAEDVNYEGLLGKPSEVLYVPEAQGATPARQTTLFVRTQGPAGRMIPKIRAAVQALDPSAPLLRVETIEARVRPQLMQWEVGTKLFSALGILAAILAAVGLYMVVSFTAAQRLKELGIRSALGAGRSHLLRMVLSQGIRVTGIGIAIGMVISLGAGALLRNQLFGLSYTDLPTYVVISGTMIFIAAAASLRPAAKAARTDPAVVLRED